MTSFGDCVKGLASAIRCAPSADNAQPWRIRFDGRALEIAYDAERVSGLTFDADNPATLLAMGAAIENLSQAASAMGLRIEEQQTRGNCFFHGRVHADTATLHPLAPDHAIFGRHTNRLQFRHERVPEALISWISAQSELNAHASVFTAPAEIKCLGQLVGLASAIRFQNKEMHELLGHSLRFTPEEVAAGNGLDVATFDLPPGGTSMLRFVRPWRRMAALNRLRAYRLFAHLESSTFSNAAACIAISAPPGRESGLSAGRLLERIWMEINRLGLAVHPFYVIPDIGFRLKSGQLPTEVRERATKIVSSVSEMLGLRHETLYMLLRIGYPTKIPVRARRLPLDTVFEAAPQDRIPG